MKNVFIENYVTSNYMMSLPDFREKQILFVEAKYGIENALKFKVDNILYTQDGVNINKISCFKVI